jgi:myo-inositol catabolism protein IolS
VEQRHLGNSALTVSVMGLGCWPLGGGWGWGDQDEQESVRTIHAALDAWINLLDTAEAYNDGHSEEVVGLALRGRRDQAIVATKISPNNAEPATLRAHCEASLKRLQTDYIDLYQMHWPIDPPMVADAFATLRDLQYEGKVRAIGISNHGMEQLGQVAATGVPVVSNQLCYSLLSRAIEFEILPYCREHGMGTLTYMALMQGLLTGKYASFDEMPPFRTRTRHFSGARPGSRHGEEGAEVETLQALGEIRRLAYDAGIPMADLAIGWVLAQPGVSCVLVGSRNRDQLQENLQAAALALAPELVLQLSRATEALKLKLGSNADYLQGGENRRTR